MTERQLYPGLDQATMAALRASIERFGVLVPVAVDQHGMILDGHHRSSIAAELGLQPPRIVHHVASEGEAREITRTLNEDRRMLTREQRLPLVRALREDGHSMTAIAGALGVSQSTVDRDLTHMGKQTMPAEATGLDGKTYPAEKPNRTQLRESAHGRRLIQGVSHASGIVRGMATDIDISMATNAIPSEELEAICRKIDDSVSVLRQIKRSIKENLS